MGRKDGSSRLDRRKERARGRGRYRVQRRELQRVEGRVLMMVGLRRVRVEVRCVLVRVRVRREAVRLRLEDGSALGGGDVEPP